MDGIGKLLHNRRESAKQADPHLHQEIHALADEISTAFGERKRFAMYLGTIKRVGTARARAVFRQIQLEGAARTPGRLFMHLCKTAKPDDPADNKEGRAGAAPAV